MKQRHILIVSIPIASVASRTRRRLSWTRRRSKLKGAWGPGSWVGVSKKSIAQ